MSNLPNDKTEHDSVLFSQSGENSEQSARKALYIKQAYANYKTNNLDGKSMCNSRIKFLAARNSRIDDLPEDSQELFREYFAEKERQHRLVRRQIHRRTDWLDAVQELTKAVNELEKGIDKE